MRWSECWKIKKLTSFEASIFFYWFFSFSFIHCIKQFRILLIVSNLWIIFLIRKIRKVSPAIIVYSKVTKKMKTKKYRKELIVILISIKFSGLIFWPISTPQEIIFDIIASIQGIYGKRKRTIPLIKKPRII